MILHLMIPRNNLRIARRCRPITRPRSTLTTSCTLLLRRVARTTSTSTTTSSTSLVIVAGSIVVGSPVVHMPLRPRLGLVSAAALLGLLAVAAVVDEHIDAAVLGVLREVGVGVVVGGLGVFGDDVPCVEEAWELWEGGVLVVGCGGGGRCEFGERRT